eukprot:1378709-Rhodomonas_salina.1
MKRQFPRDVPGLRNHKKVPEHFVLWFTPAAGSSLNSSSFSPNDSHVLAISDARFTHATASTTARAKQLGPVPHPYDI